MTPQTAETLDGTEPPVDLGSRLRGKLEKHLAVILSLGTVTFVALRVLAVSNFDLTTAALVLNVADRAPLLVTGVLNLVTFSLVPFCYFCSYTVRFSGTSELFRVAALSGLLIASTLILGVQPWPLFVLLILTSFILDRRISHNGRAKTSRQKLLDQVQDLRTTSSELERVQSELDEVVKSLQVGSDDLEERLARRSRARWLFTAAFSYVVPKMHEKLNRLPWRSAKRGLQARRSEIEALHRRTEESRENNQPIQGQIAKLEAYTNSWRSKMPVNLAVRAFTAAFVLLIVIATVYVPWTPKERLTIRGGTFIDGYIVGSMDGQFLVLSKSRRAAWIRVDSVKTREVCGSDLPWYFTTVPALIIQDSYIECSR